MAPTKQSEFTKAVNGFIDNQRRWAEGRTSASAAEMMISQSQALKELGAQYDSSLEAFVAVVGDQSAGKTVVVMSLLRQVILDVQADIGTTVRTKVKQACNLGQKKDYECTLMYKCDYLATGHQDFSKDNLTPHAVLQEYQKLSKYNRENHESRVDTENICHITLTTKEPALGFQVIDHAGFASSVLEPVRQSFEATLHEYFTGERGPRCPNASVLLCHRLDKQASEGFFCTCHKEYNHVLPGQLYMAITQCDRLKSEDQKERLAQDMKQKNYNIDENGKVKVRPSDILEFLKTSCVDFTYKDPNDDFKAVKPIPKHVQVFFVSSYKGQVDKLMQEKDPKKRFEKFLNDPEHGELATEKVFKHHLRNKEEWLKFEVILRDEEPEKVDDMIGMRKLITALQKNSAQGFSDCANKFIKNARANQEKTMESMMKARVDQVPEVPPGIAESMILSLQLFVEQYRVFTASDLDDPGRNVSGPKQVALQQMKNIMDHNKAQDNFGYTLKTESELYEQLPVKGDFPPVNPKFCYEDFEEAYEELLPFCVQHLDDEKKGAIKECNLTSLVRRFQQEFALLSCLIKAPEVDVKTLLKDRRIGIAQQTGSVTDALMHQIHTVYSEIYRGPSHRNPDPNNQTPTDDLGHAGGIKYVAARIALACLLHGQVILNTMKDVKVSEVTSVLGLAGAAGKFPEPKNESVLGRFDLVTHPLHLMQTSRVQNVKHPARKRKGKESSRHTGSDLTLEDVITNTQRHLHEHHDRRKAIGNAFDDFCKVIVAQFFDQQFEDMERKLDYLVHKIEISSPAYIPMSLHLGPLLMHQDHEFLLDYKKSRPMDHYPHKFIKRTDSPNRQQQEQQEPTPQEYKGEHARLFDKLQRETEDAVIKINGVRQVNHRDRARLLGSLIKADKLPDIMSAFENSQQFGDFDTKWLEFACQRHVSSSIKRTLDDVLEACAAVVHDFMRPGDEDRMEKDMLNRFESLCLGYDYPYTCAERPRDQKQFNEGEVIEFLHAKKSYILKVASDVKASGERSDCNSKTEPSMTLSFTDAEESPGPKLSKMDSDIANSPLFITVVKTALEKPEKAFNLIDQLYEAWADIQRDEGYGYGGYETSRGKLTLLILQTVLPYRYWNRPKKSAGEGAAEALEKNYQETGKFITALESFQGFVGDHGHHLSRGVQQLDHKARPAWNDESAKKLSQMKAASSGAQSSPGWSQCVFEDDDQEDETVQDLDEGPFAWLDSDSE